MVPFLTSTKISKMVSHMEIDHISEASEATKSRMGQEWA
jgi:hypothetical protein